MERAIRASSSPALAFSSRAARSSAVAVRSPKDPVMRGIIFSKVFSLSFRKAAIFLSKAS